VEALGNELHVHFTIDAQRVLTEAVEAEDELTIRRGEGVARVDPRVSLAAGSHARFEVDTGRMHFFDPDTTKAIRA
jgi:multiple sugar transport system ATP-binding protein